MRECEHAHVSGRGVFMEELLAELERRGVAFARWKRSARKKARAAIPERGPVHEGILDGCPITRKKLIRGMWAIIDSCPK